MIKSKHFSKSNIIFTVLMALALVTLVNPTAKSFFIRGLMSVGFFQPDPEGYLRHHKVIATLPDYRYRDTSGHIIALSDLKHKVVFVNYWATWCPPCLAEMPSINKLHEKLKNNPKIVFIMVDVDNDPAKATAFLRKHNYNLPVYTTLNQLPDTLLDGTIPTTLVFDKTGVLKYNHSGASDYSSDSFKTFLNKEANENF
jgi:thiol-disulfide isomerase/thioredoxin